jgi:hypothetical protein
MAPLSVPAPPDNHGTGLRIVVALALIVAGPVLYVAYERWLSRQTFPGFELPVSLSPGRIKTAPFYIHLEEQYSIQIRIDEGPYEGPPCRVIWDSSFRSRWTLFRDGQPIKEATSRVYWHIGDFYADKEGSYSVVLEVLTDASCLNVRRPRLTVSTWSGNYQNQLRFAGWFSIVPVLGGLGLIGVVLTRVFRRRTSAADTPQFRSRRRSAQRQRLARRRFESLPPFGLFATLWFVVIGAIFWAFPWGREVWGLHVTVVSRVPFPAGRAPHAQPLVVAVTEAQESRGHVYLGSQMIATERLGPMLRDEFKRRADWVVYVEAERDVSWEHVIQVMDVVQGELAQMVLVTQPRTGRR